MLKFAFALGLAIAAHTTAAPFDAKSMHVSAQESGYCWVSSIASQRSDAYRCMVGNEIHDPCFVLSAHSVACPVDAAANSGIAIALTKPLPQASAKSVSNAWAMEIAPGVLCNIGTGTTLPGYPYYCSGGLVCSAPPPGKPAAGAAVFVRCAGAANGKLTARGSYLVRVLYL